MKDAFGGLMQQAQKIQEQMKKMQEELAQQQQVGEAGAGLVTVTMTGRHDVVKVQIDPSLMKEELSILEDLIAAAVNDAVRKIELQNKQKMADVTGGINLPADFKMPF